MVDPPWLRSARQGIKSRRFPAPRSARGSVAKTLRRQRETPPFARAPRRSLADLVRISTYAGEGPDVLVRQRVRLVASVVVGERRSRAHHRGVHGQARDVGEVEA